MVQLGRKPYRGRGFSSRGIRGRGKPVGRKRSDFRTSRVEERRGTIDLGPRERNNRPSQGSDEDSVTDESSEQEDEKQNGANSYGQLLQLLKLQRHEHAPPRKKRRIHDDSGDHGNTDVTPNGAKGSVLEQHPPTHSPTELGDVDEPDSEVEDGLADDDGPVGDQEDDERGGEDPADPFESRYTKWESTAASTRLESIKAKRWISTSSALSSEIKQYSSEPTSQPEPPQHILKVRDATDLHIKHKYIESGQKVWRSLAPIERDIAAPIFTYRDLLFGSRTADNASRLKDLATLHALNHILKVRSRVLKNNSRLSQDESSESLELRDQGFTRPKVLFILPTRQACVRIAEGMVKICEPEQQENRSRFMESYSQADEDLWADKPRDFQELFGGNDDDMFRIGIKFTRKTIKFFSAFYQSDVILASPLGLRTAIETSQSEDGNKGDSSNADFLSSIELVIVDHANALLMQNWSHVEFVFSEMNLLPKQSHGCDFSRVQHVYLDGEARYFRQTIVLTDFITPEINSLFANHMLNLSGKIKYAPIYKGAMLDTPASSFPTGNISQSFVRLNAPSPSSDADVRFSTFISTILPSLLTKPVHKRQDPGTAQGNALNSGSLIFIPHYHDFVRLRNHLSTSSSLSFGTISEYSSVRDVSRARSHFASGRHSLLIYSERAHHFRRYKLKGVRRIVFYGLPENPVFWGELVAFLTVGNGQQQQHNGATATTTTIGSTLGSSFAIKALFSRWDVLKLERIVGSDRVGRMIADATADTFVFTS